MQKAADKGKAAVEVGSFEDGIAHYRTAIGVDPAHAVRTCYVKRQSSMVVVWSVASITISSHPSPLVFHTHHHHHYHHNK